MELILENVRSFAGKHVIPIRPLTVLIGENSSGKSTFLAALSVVCAERGFPIQPNFNEPPYSLGNFDTIATYKPGKRGHATHFSIGCIRSDSADETRTEVLATYRNNKGKIELSGLTSRSSQGEVILELDETTKKYGVALRLDREAPEMLRFSMDLPPVEETVRAELPKFLSKLGAYLSKDPKERDSKEMVDASTVYLIVLGLLASSMPQVSPVSIAPIRTKPRRTYDQFSDNFRPEGDHVPFILARILNESPTSKQETSFISILERFGAESGLFKNIGVKRLGDNPGDPFQVLVTVAGRPANMLDVGYGVSQALPVVVQSILVAEERLLLLQQPEVHLHPRAQAALGSFFVDIVATAKKRMVIETHSDYIVDRIRQEIALGKIAPEDVIFHYLEKKEIETTVYPITMDGLGNLDGAPPSYREFFLREAMNLLSRGD